MLPSSLVHNDTPGPGLTIGGNLAAVPDTSPDVEVEVVEVEAEVEESPPAKPKSKTKDAEKSRSNGSSEVAVREAAEWMVTGQDWAHEWLDFEGDRLAVRKPTEQALAGFSLAMSKYVSNETRNDITGLFIARHLSPEAWSRVFSRLMDGDDPGYTKGTVGELMRLIVELRTGPSAVKAKS